MQDVAHREPTQARLWPHLAYAGIGEKRDGRGWGRQRDMREAVPLPKSAIDSHNWEKAPAWLDARSVARRLADTKIGDATTLPASPQSLTEAPTIREIFETTQNEGFLGSSNPPPSLSGNGINEDATRLPILSLDPKVVTDPSPVDPSDSWISVPITIEASTFSLVLRWSKSRRWYRYTIDCPKCGKAARGLYHTTSNNDTAEHRERDSGPSTIPPRDTEVAQVLACKYCVQGKRSPSRCPRVLRPVKVLTEYERRERARRKVARVAGAQRYREPETVEVHKPE